MTDLPLHPAVVHLPLGLSFVMPLVAIGIAIAVRRGRLPRAAFAVVTGLQLLLAGSAFVAMQLGHHDERRVEKIVGERAIDAHEERGEALVWTAAGVAALGIALLVVPARAVGLVSALTVAGTLAVATLAYLTGEAGGAIIYRHGGASAYATPSAPVPRSGDVDSDEDEHEHR